MTPEVALFGLDDAGRPGRRSTSKLCLGMVETLATQHRCLAVTEHLHLQHPSITNTRGNRSCCMSFEIAGQGAFDDLVHALRSLVLEDLLAGTSPGLCAARAVSSEVRAFGARSQAELLTAEEAHALARTHGLVLEGLAEGGRGIIGALAAVGLAAAGGPGVFLRVGGRDLLETGLLSPARLARLGIDRFVDAATNADVSPAPLWVPRALRPVMIGGQPAVLVEPFTAGTLAMVEPGLGWRGDRR